MMNRNREDSSVNIVVSEPLCTIREQMVYTSNLPRRTNDEVKENRLSKEEQEEKQIRQFMVHYSAGH